MFLYFLSAEKARIVDVEYINRIEREYNKRGFLGFQAGGGETRNALESSRLVSSVPTFEDLSVERDCRFAANEAISLLWTVSSSEIVLFERNRDARKHGTSTNGSGSKIKNREIDREI